jgi:hypothetical protein
MIVAVWCSELDVFMSLAGDAGVLNHVQDKRLAVSPLTLKYLYIHTYLYIVVSRWIIYNIYLA